MDILPSAIDGFALHPLDATSSLLALANNRVDDRFPGSAVLTFQYFLVKEKRSRLASQQVVAPPSQPFPYPHNNKEDYRQPTALWGVIRVTRNGNLKEACEALA
jgi:hypothetical protein